MVTEDDVISPFATPNLAEKITVPKVGLKNLQREIQVLGAMQWTKIDESSGTYTIATQDNIEFDVYKPYDLSRLISFVEERETLVVGPGQETGNFFENQRPFLVTLIPLIFAPRTR